MTSNRKIVKQNADNQQRSGDLVPVDHDLIPVQKVMKPETGDA
jgi:hypothetical protein